MKKLTRSETAQFLRRQDHFLILTHRRPDGDTVGSAAALCRILRRLGKDAHILHNPELPPRFSWLVEGLTVETVSDGACIVSTDVASPGMLPKSFLLLQDKVQLRIDHHGSSTSFTEVELVEPDSASCAEILYDLGMELLGDMDKATAEAVYVGTSTDTGCFRYANTTAHTFRVAAECAAAGAEIFRLNQELFETNNLSKLRLQAWMTEHLQLFDEGRLAICAIPRSVEAELGVTEEDVDNISSFPRTVRGVCMAATLRETEEGGVKLSVRAVPGWDAAKVCEHFGGGGHKGAAGASTTKSLAETVLLVKEYMLET